MQRNTLAVICLVVLASVAAAGAGYGIRALISWGGPGNFFAGIHSRTGRIGAAAALLWRGEPTGEGSPESERSLRAELERLRDVEEENEFLRRIADLPARQSWRSVPAGIYSSAVLGQRLHIVMNRGSADGIVPGSAVVTADGILVGIVGTSVSLHSSDIVAVGDPDLQITGRVAGTEVSGLVRGFASGAVMLDMVSKDEPVPEGATVVTGGLDRIPAGLTIGTVRTVNPESTTLFQDIRLSASRAERPVGRVLVLIP